MATRWIVRDANELRLAGRGYFILGCEPLWFVEQWVDKAPVIRAGPFETREAATAAAMLMEAP